MRPRFAKQAVGAIAKLVNNKEGKMMTCNVEYNQPAPLRLPNLEGDVNDPETGKSTFPGNINQLIFSLPPTGGTEAYGGCGGGVRQPRSRRPRLLSRSPRVWSA